MRNKLLYNHSLIHRRDEVCNGQKLQSFIILMEISCQRNYYNCTNYMYMCINRFGLISVRTCSNLSNNIWVTSSSFFIWIMLATCYYYWTEKILLLYNINNSKKIAHFFENGPRCSKHYVMTDYVPICIHDHGIITFIRYWSTFPGSIQFVVNFVLQMYYRYIQIYYIVKYYYFPQLTVLSNNFNVSNSYSYIK